jgi:hypothetical protein
VKSLSYPQRVRIVFTAIGIFGAAIAISGLIIALPKPAAGGTCGPGTASEAPIVAALDPVSIGAGREPASSDTKSYEQWLAFVGECQASADGTVLAAVLILMVSAGIAVGGPLLLLRKTKGPREPSPA